MKAVALLVFATVLVLSGCSSRTAPSDSDSKRHASLEKGLCGTWHCHNEEVDTTFTFLSDRTFTGVFDFRGRGTVKVINWFLGDANAIIGRTTCEGTWQLNGDKLSLFVIKDILENALTTKSLDDVVGRTWKMNISDIASDHFYSKRATGDNEPSVIDLFKRVN